MKIVSACLAGLNCRYNGKNASNDYVIELVKKGEAIPVCPEIMGGLPTPREPVEIKEGRCVTKEGRDLTDNFLQGVQEALGVAILAECKEAILKSGSPCCGYNDIYDGTFTGTKVKRNGLFAELLIRRDVKVYSENDF